MASTQYTLFETALGPCGIAWRGGAIAAVQLPEPTEAATAGQLLTKLEGAEHAKPPAFVRDAMRRLERHLRGEAVELAAVPLALEGLPTFRRRVYEVLRTLPAGTTASYGEVAAMAGSPGAARAVGQAMAQNPFSLLVPCHRVVGAGRSPGGFTSSGGLETKAKLLAIEGVALAPGRRRSERAGLMPWDTEEAVAMLRRSDAKLAGLIDRVGPCTLAREALQSPYEALARAVIHQQLHGKAAATIAARVAASFGRQTHPPPALFLAAADAPLRAAGLSRNKVAALRDLAEKTLDGTVPSLARLEEMGDAEIVEALTVVRGIGAWTVQMMLIFRLGRPDVLPVDDFGVRHGFGRTFLRGRHPEKAEVAKRGERWRPFRSVASWYLWRASELPK